jgi:LemA protein
VATGLIVVLIALLALVAVLYNGLVRDRNRVNAAWSDIDVQLQRRHDLVPQLVKAVRHYSNWEKATLEAVTALRDAATRETRVSKLGDIEARLGDGMNRLLVLAESYPDLKASDNFLSLQRQLVETENYLQFARRFYNGAVRALNTRIGTVPHNIVAAAFGFAERDYFQKASDDVAAVPLVEMGSVE